MSDLGSAEPDGPRGLGPADQAAIRDAVAVWATRRSRREPILRFFDGTTVRAWELTLLSQRRRTASRLLYRRLASRRAVRVDRHILDLVAVEVEATRTSLDVILADLRSESEPPEAQTGTPAPA